MLKADHRCVDGPDDKRRDDDEDHQLTAAAAAAALCRMSSVDHSADALCSRICILQL